RGPLGQPVAAAPPPGPGAAAGADHPGPPRPHQRPPPGPPLPGRRAVALGPGLRPPGSFKTHGLVIPAILEWQGNLVTTSIKPDVLRATCAHRANLGAVWVYDPLGLSGVP